MERAFVVQLRREPDLELGIFEGRVEHVDSGCSTRFETLEEFLTFVVSSIIRSEPGAESI
jgi:hypothetical protein